MAASTHPIALWREQKQTPKERYSKVMSDIQMLGLRDMLCGMHVHVELPDPERRVEVMYRTIPFLPALVALSTSSPFWQGHRTGLLGYRLAAYDELPRTGPPELFRTKAEYETYVDALVSAGLIENASFIWWALRPRCGSLPSSCGSLTSVRGLRMDFALRRSFTLGTPSVRSS